MSQATVQVEPRGAVAVVRLNRPASANTINLQMAMDLLAAAMTCARNSAVRAVVLTGAGRHFSFGGDLRAITSREDVGADYVRELTTYLHAALSQFARMDPPVALRPVPVSVWSRRRIWRCAGAARASTSPTPTSGSPPTAALRFCCRAWWEPSAPWS